MANNFIFMFGVGIAMFAFSLLFAAVLSNRDFPGRKFFKTVLFAPYVVSVVAIAVLWTFIYDPKWGLLNSLLSVLVTWAVQAAHALHLTQMETYQVGILWLGSRWMSILSMAVVMVWGGVGFYVILLIAGIDRIPGDYYEAAKIDGATEKQYFLPHHSAAPEGGAYHRDKHPHHREPETIRPRVGDDEGDQFHPHDGDVHVRRGV